MIKLATVSPCYNEEEVLEKSVERLTHLFKEMIAAEKISPDSKIVFVNDGSRDHTWDIICKLQKQNPFVCGINLAHNVGHQYAIMAGMMTMKDHADAVITIDADLQDDLKAIPQMVDDFAEGNDIVYGVKVSRQADPVLKRMSAGVLQASGEDGREVHLQSCRLPPHESSCLEHACRISRAQPLPPRAHSDDRTEAHNGRRHHQ